MTATPSMTEFWEANHAVIYAAIRNTINTKDHDAIMDRVVDCFCLRYDAMAGNFHPDYGLEFGTYIVYMTKRYAWKTLLEESRRRPLTDDTIEIAYDTVPDLDLGYLPQELQWLARRLVAGYTLKELSRTSKYSYTELRAFKQQLTNHLR